ncbi:MAG: Hpt domain-containing protein [Flavobacteriales bacterium]|nr:Hpt domain-containing protein [Flavobacteriales bacterium]
MAAVDLEYLERFCKGDRSRMEKYIRMYLDASPGLFADLAAKAGSGDAEGLAVAAHSLRPQVNYMGAQGLFDTLTTIEGLARAEGIEGCKELVDRLPGMNAEVIAELRAAIGSAG